jgi:hypothetical protein
LFDCKCDAGIALFDAETPGWLIERVDHGSSREARRVSLEAGLAPGRLGAAARGAGAGWVGCSLRARRLGAGAEEGGIGAAASGAEILCLSLAAHFVYGTWAFRKVAILADECGLDACLARTEEFLPRRRRGAEQRRIINHRCTQINTDKTRYFVSYLCLSVCICGSNSSFFLLCVSAVQNLFH